MLPDFCCTGLAFRASVVGIALLLGGGTSELRAQVATAPQATPATPAIQSVPTREEAELSAALSRLSREPGNVEALILAGNAASKLGDFEAAVGFFKRGEALAPALLAALLTAFGTSRLLWASDWPHTQHETLVTHRGCFEALERWAGNRALASRLRTEGIASLLEGT